MLLRDQSITQKTITSTKSLSHNSRIFNQSKYHIPFHNTSAKALPCRRRLSGSLTVEACLTVPVFLLVVFFFLGFFNLLRAEVQITAGMQYTARIVAVSYQSEHLLGEAKGDQKTAADYAKEVGGSILSRTEGRLLFNHYMKEHGFDESLVVNGLSGISFLTSDYSGDYVTLRAGYRVKLPISVGTLRTVPVRQRVKAKKWNGASGGDKEEEEKEYVYVTPTGTVYHTTDTCTHIKLSLRTTPAATVKNKRNRSGGIYYPCSCYKPGSAMVYITDYGTEYHSDTSCGNIKRTVIRKAKDEVAGMRACSKCGGS